MNWRWQGAYTTQCQPMWWCQNWCDYYRWNGWVCSEQPVVPGSDKKWYSMVANWPYGTITCDPYSWSGWGKK